MYVAMRYVRWEDLELESEALPFPANITKELIPGCGGFMPVFNSIESLREQYPDADYFEVRGINGG